MIGDDHHVACHRSIKRMRIGSLRASPSLAYTLVLDLFMREIHDLKQTFDRVVFVTSYYLALMVTSHPRILLSARRSCVSLWLRVRDGCHRREYLVYDQLVEYTVAVGHNFLMSGASCAWAAPRKASNMASACSGAYACYHEYLITRHVVRFIM
jgi:hypothetical protein